MPVTVRAARAIASARMPPPQPTSRTRLPARPPATRSIQSRRSGLISCSGRNSLSGSHQRCASAQNLASSAGSALRGRQARGCVAVGHRVQCGQASRLLPRARARQRARLRRSSSSGASSTTTLAARPRRRSRARGRRHGRGAKPDRTRQRRRRRPGRPPTRSACLPAASEPIRASRPSARAPFERGHPQRRRRRQRGRVAGRDLGEQAREAHFAEEVEAVVGRGAVGAERDVDAAREQRRDRRDAARELHVRRRAVHDVAALRARAGRCRRRRDAPRGPR